MYTTPLSTGLAKTVTRPARVIPHRNAFVGRPMLLHWHHCLSLDQGLLARRSLPRRMRTEPAVWRFCTPNGFHQPGRSAPGDGGVGIGGRRGFGAALAKARSALG